MSPIVTVHLGLKWLSPSLQAFDQVKNKWLLIASDTLKCVRIYFEANRFLDQSKEVKQHAWWALRPDGPAYHATPTPIDCPCKLQDPMYIVSHQWVLFLAVMSSLSVSTTTISIQIYCAHCKEVSSTCQQLRYLSQNWCTEPTNWPLYTVLILTTVSLFLIFS